jgi:hypothetical protein
MIDLADFHDVFTVVFCSMSLQQHLKFSVPESIASPSHIFISIVFRFLMRRKMLGLKVI